MADSDVTESLRDILQHILHAGNSFLTISMMLAINCTSAEELRLQGRSALQPSPQGTQLLIPAMSNNIGGQESRSSSEPIIPK